MNRNIPDFPASNLLNVFILSFFFLFVSCASPEKARYFDQSVPSQYPLVSSNLDPVIQKADILSIVVSSLNPDASLIFNTNSTVPAGYYAPGANPPVGYLVDSDGLITFPIIGQVKAGGLTKKQLSDSLTHVLSSRKLLIDPIVSVRLINFRVTVLGEVGRPTVVNVNNERISLMEAIGMAGDLTLSAKRDNVLLIREENNKNITRRINLNDESLFRSPYYYLKNNDIIYVEANKARVQGTSRFTQLLPAILSGFTFLAIIIDRIGR